MPPYILGFFIGQGKINSSAETADIPLTEENKEFHGHWTEFCESYIGSGRTSRDTYHGLVRAGILGDKGEIQVPDCYMINHIMARRDLIRGYIESASGQGNTAEHGVGGVSKKAGLDVLESLAFIFRSTGYRAVIKNDQNGKPALIEWELPKDGETASYPFKISRAEDITKSVAFYLTEQFIVQKALDLA